jgi:lipid A oxidase
MRFAVFSVTVLLSTAPAALAGQLEIGLYGGMNESSHTYAELSDGIVTEGGYFKWEGNSFEMPIYYGAKATYWLDTMPWGFGIDFTHAKAYADLDQLGGPGNYTTLEFTDGLNLVTANAYYRHDWDSGLRVYGGGGAGVAIPHVEVTTTANTVVGETETFGYQLTGPAFQAVVGGSYEFADNWRVFAEYKLSYAVVDADLDGGGSFSTDFTSHHVLAGLSYAFDAGDW